jgi:hypothetical protein
VTEHASWKFASWHHLSPVVDICSSASWDWQMSSAEVQLESLGWKRRKLVRSMVLFDTDLPTGAEAVLRLDNDNKDALRSVAIGVTTVVTAHESNTRKAKAFMAESYATTSESLTSAFGEPAETGETSTRWVVESGHVVLTATPRSVRMTFYSATGLLHADAAANAKAAMVGVEKKKKAPAPWRVRQE